MTIKLEDSVNMSIEYTIPVTISNNAPVFTGGDPYLKLTVSLMTTVQHTLPAYADPDEIGTITLTLALVNPDQSSCMLLSGS